MRVSPIIFPQQVFAQKPGRTADNRGRGKNRHDLQDYQDFILHNLANHVNPVHFWDDSQVVFAYDGLVLSYQKPRSGAFPEKSERRVKDIPCVFE
jgi:hypothetical protein